MYRSYCTLMLTELKTNATLHRVLYMLLQAGNFLNTVRCSLHDSHLIYITALLNVVVTCEIKLLQNYFSDSAFVDVLTEIILPKLIS